MATNAYEIAAQARTLPTATRTGTHWTQTELDQLRAFREQGKPGTDIATALHRTLYGVRAAARVRTERAEIATRTARPVLPYDLGYTDIESLFA